MNTAKIIPFQFGPREVRTLLVNDQPWFVAKDVARALQYRDSEKMTRNLDDDEKDTQIVGTPGGGQEMTVINESGLYSAILRSRKPEAKQFKKWVTSEVLPSIRKHGQYEDRSGKLGTLVGETIGTDGFRVLGAVVEGKINHFPAKVKQRARSHIWSQVHKAFSVVSAQDIPAAQLDSVRNFIGGYALEGEWIGAELDSAPVVKWDANYIDNLASLCKTVLLIDNLWGQDLAPALERLGCPVAKEVTDYMAVASSMSRFAINQPGVMFPSLR